MSILNRNKDQKPAETNASNKKWNTAHGKANYRVQFSMNHPVVSKYIHDTYLNGMQPLGLLKNHLTKTPVPRALELACGRGDLALGIAAAGFVKQVDAYDMSEKAIELANEKAKQRNLKNIRFDVADVNEVELPENTYDLVIFSQALHHIENLEHIYKQISKTLTKDGLFFVSDYVGPSRMQWTDSQLAVINEILSILPEQYRSLLSSDIGYPGTHKVSVKRVPVTTYLKIDPSEGVRAAEIVPLAHKYFQIVEEQPLGGTLHYELLRGIVHNFNGDDYKDTAVIKLILLMEKLLIENKVIDSDFKCFIAKNRIS